RRADIAIEPAHLAQEKRREPQSAALRALCLLLIKVQFPRPMPVARHTQVVGFADVDSEFHRVILNLPRHVADELELLFVLVEGAVAAIDAEARPEVEAAVAFDKAAEESGRKAAVQVQAWNAGVLCGRRAEIERQHVNLVLEPAEAKIGCHLRADGSVEAEREAVVLHFGRATKRHELLAPTRTEGRRSVAIEGRYAVAAEHVEPVADSVVQPDVDGVVIERLGA